MTRSVMAHLAGLVVLFVAVRMVGGDITAFGWIAALSAIGLGVSFRLAQMRRAQGETRAAHRRALVFALISGASLGLYALAGDNTVDALGLGDEAAKRWSAVFGALFPVFLLVGTLPLLLIDRALADMPLGVQPRRIAHATDTGLVVALAVALAFPVNYLAQRHDSSKDLRYLKTTAAGEATLAVAASLDEPIRAILFFPPANEVQSEARPYFEALASASEFFTVEDADHDLQPDLAKEFRVSSNGTIALVKGSDVERINLGRELKSAGRNLKKLDQTVLEKLLKLTRKARVAYVTTGHGEAHWSGSDASAFHKMVALKKILGQLNYRVKELSLNNGLGKQIPDDAALVMVPGPTRSFLPEEVDALERYLTGGGRLLLFLPAGEESHEALTGLLGVKFIPTELHNDRSHAARTRTIADRALIITNSYSSHPSVTTLSKNSRRLIMVAPNTGSLEMVKDPSRRMTETVRTPANTWADLDGDHEFDGDQETRKVHILGVAVQGIESDMRGAVLANFAAMSDGALSSLQANYQYFVDTVNWLTGDEKLSGMVEVEEDVRIEHTRDEDTVWFWGTTAFVPAFVVLVGLIRVRMRRRSS